MSTSEYLLEIDNVSKSYGETEALVNVNVKFESGKVIGIIGSNGAGKTTLVKVISGEEDFDSGTILLNNKEFKPTRDASKVAIVHQEVRLFPNLTVCENLLIGTSNFDNKYFKPKKTNVIDEIAQELGLTKYLDRELKECSLVISQLTEIAKTLISKNDSQIFLFDEPNSALSSEESEELFLSVKKIAKQGNIVVFISHRLAELADIADEVIVVRDGSVVRVYKKGEFNEEILVNELTIGYSNKNVAEKSVSSKNSNSRESDKLLDIKNLQTPDGRLNGIDISVAPKEILGLFGVEGSGVRELIQSIDKSIDDENFSIYLPAERTKSLFRLETINNNLIIRTDRTNLAKKNGLMRFAHLFRQVARLVREFSIRTSNPFLPITSLSGGNQQKVAIASAIVRNSKVLLLEEPTRGVDISSKKDIYEMLRSYVANGFSCIAMCTELPEIYELVDRCLIISDGKVVGEVLINDFKSIEDLATKLTLLSSGKRK